MKKLIYILTFSFVLLGFTSKVYALTPKCDNSGSYMFRCYCVDGTQTFAGSGEYNTYDACKNNCKCDNTSDSTENFCTKSGSVLQIVGYVLLVLKIVVPVIIIVLASIDMSKAVVSGEDKAVKEQSWRLIKRIILGVVIFLIPTIVKLVFFSISYFSDNMKTEFNNCVACLTSPKSCDTSYKGGIFK